MLRPKKTETGWSVILNGKEIASCTSEQAAEAVTRLVQQVALLELIKLTEEYGGYEIL